MKVAVCNSSGGTVMSSFDVCSSALIATSATNGVPITIINAESSLNMVNRNYAVREATKRGCSHVFFVDSDMVFPADALLRLIEAERDIVGCLYARRVAPFATLGRLVDPTTTDAIAEAEEMGIGCVLIRMAVFDRLRAPYFRCPAIESLENPPAELEGMDLTGIEAPDIMDDSIWFSKAARRAGFKLWIDQELTLEIGHTGFTTHYVPRKAA